MRLEASRPGRKALRRGPGAAAALLAAALLTVAACAAPEGSSYDQVTGEPQPDEWLTDFRVGTDVSPRGTVLERNHASRFTQGMIVYYSMRVTEPRPSPYTKVTVVWGVNQDAVDEEETRRTGGEESLVFATDTTDWPAGHYAVEVRVGDEQVDEQIFEVVEIGA